MTANDIKLLTEKNYSRNAKELTLRELEEIADNCEYYPETEIINELVEAYRTVMNYNPEPITYDKWKAKYKPLKNDDGGCQAYETFKSDTYEWDLNAMIGMATSLANGDPDRAFLHVWTEVDADVGNETIIVNGIRRVNRIQYFICKVPFSDTIEDGLNLYQEVHDD